jgi:hypothetical protein
MNIRNANSIGTNVFISLIGEAEQICRMNDQTTENLQIFWGVRLALPIGGIIT